MSVASYLYKEYLIDKKINQHIVNNEFSHEIPTIRFIDGIKVCTTFHIKKCPCCTDHSISLSIYSCGIPYGPTHKLYELYRKELRSKVKKINKKQIKLAVIKMKKILHSLKFDKIIAKLSQEQDKTFNQICLDEFSPDFVGLDKCCVCYDSTITQTDCGHKLCIQCWPNLKTEKCPICRKSNIFLINPLEDNCSDSDDSYSVSEVSYSDSEVSYSDDEESEQESNV